MKRTLMCTKNSSIDLSIYIPAKTQKIENSNLHELEVNRLSSKGTKLLFQVVRANKNIKIYNHMYIYKYVYIYLCIHTYKYRYIY